MKNVYTFNNIIYLPLPKSELIDPFSFYFLERIDNDAEQIRYWKMDCRLDEFISDMIPMTIEECIKLFRDIYQKVYHDNEYRENFRETHQIFDYEGLQLINNLIILSDKYKFIKRVQQLVMDNSTYQPTMNDKFNLYSDDPLLKKEFLKLKEQKDKDQLVINNIKLLFDNFKDIDVVNFYNSLNNLI